MRSGPVCRCQGQLSPGKTQSALHQAGHIVHHFQTGVLAKVFKKQLPSECLEADLYLSVQCFWNPLAHVHPGWAAQQATLRPISFQEQTGLLISQYSADVVIEDLQCIIIPPAISGKTIQFAIQPQAYIGAAESPTEPGNHGHRSGEAGFLAGKMIALKPDPG